MNDKCQMINDKCKQGQSLFEVLFAVGIVSIILVGVVSLATSSVRNASFSNNNAVATKYAQEATEWLREERDRGFSDFINNINSDPSLRYCLDASPLDSTSWGNPGSCLSTETIVVNGISTIFIREATDFSIVDIDGDGVKSTVFVTVNVSWQDAQGTHQVGNVTRLTDWNR